MTAPLGASPPSPSQNYSNEPSSDVPASGPVQTPPGVAGPAETPLPVEAMAVTALGTSGSQSKIDIEVPDIMDSDEALLLLTEWNARISDTMANTLTTSLKNRQAAIKAETDRAVKKIEEFFRKLKSMMAKQKLFKIVGWAVKIAAVVVAAACVATGAGAPAAVGLLMAAAALTSQMTGVNLDPASFLKEGMGGSKGAGIAASWMTGDVGGVAGGIADASGASEEDVAIVTAVVGVAAALAMGAAMSKVGGGVSVVPEAWAKKVQDLGQVVKGLMAALEGSVGVVAAVAENESAQAQAESKLIDAIIQNMQRNAQQEVAVLKTLQESSASFFSTVSDCIKTNADGRSQVQQQIGSLA